MIISTKCSNCGSDDTNDFGSQFYTYYSCKCCSHCFGLYTEEGSKKLSKKFAERNHPQIEISKLISEQTDKIKNTLWLLDGSEKLPNTPDKYDAIVLSNFLEYSFCPYTDVLSALSLLNDRGMLFMQIQTNNNPKDKFFGRAQEFSTLSAQIFADNCDSYSMVYHDDNYSVVKMTRKTA